MQILRSVFKGAKPEKHTDGRTIYRAVATGSKVDRYGEVVIPRGVISEAFLKNPVMLQLHKYDEPPVGTVLGIDVMEDHIEFDFVFSAEGIGPQLERQYVNREMNAFSIGFIPQKWVSAWDIRQEDGTYPKSFEIELPDGSKQKIDLGKYKKMPVRFYSAWELLEISPVSVPAYADALMIRSLVEEEREFANPMEEEFFEDAVTTALKELEPHLTRFVEETHGFTFKGAVPKHSTPVIEEAWDGAAARAKLAKWASSDGTGNKDTVTWTKYARGFAYVDDEMKEGFGGYKLPHHTISESKLVAVKRGVTAAMAALLGARGGTDVGEDGKAVYGHLVGHYKDMEMEPPSYDKSYEESELKAIADGTWVKSEDATGVAPTEPTSTDGQSGEAAPVSVSASLAANVEATIAAEVAKRVEVILAEFKRYLGEYMSDTSVKLNMLHDMVTDLSNQRGKKTLDKKEDKGAEPVVSITKELQGLLNRVAPLPEDGTKQ